jgi:transaldolase/glucose-6-phosphate isomerase
MDAFRDHGRLRASLEEDIPGAETMMATLEEAGISIDEITARLVEDGVRLFAEAADNLYAAVQKKRRTVLGGKLNAMTYKLPPDLSEAVKGVLDDWRKEGKARRLWAGDASLWTNTDEAKWLGWLNVVDAELKDAGRLESVAADIKRAGFADAVLLGMGGSSLGPEVLGQTFGPGAGFPKLHILDSTDPAQIRHLESAIDIARTLFIVSSKSGSTLEPNIFKQYFWDRAKAVLGEDGAAQHFIAITDPGSALEESARKEKFHAVCHGLPTIGGRYSVLSDFGMIPAAASGIAVRPFLERTAAMVRSCAASVPPVENPGIVLGAILGAAAKMGRDKLTVIASPGIAGVGAWLEQLLAESTGKLGRGIVPLDGEPIGAPAVYGSDRLFAYLRLSTDQDSEREQTVAALEAAGQPVVRITVSDKLQLGQEFFRWEIATAVAGSVLGIDPFDQPDVEAQKIKTRELTAAYESTGKLPPEEPFFTADGIALYADPANAEVLKRPATTLPAILKAHLARAQAGDYVALLAYIERNPAHSEALTRLRRMIRDRTRAATCLGFGPRFLHSTGQAYKGGPNSGVILQITADDAEDLPVPGQRYTFGVVKAAQARGDFDVLAERGRRLLRVHLTQDVEAGLKTLTKAIEQALQ